MQQDLIDELLQLFRLNKSLKVDKEPNRSIRNELIGHPIRRKLNKQDKTNELYSYSIFSYEAKVSSIEYLRYEKENDYKFEIVHLSANDIIERHISYLQKYFDELFERIMKILSKFDKNINLLSSQIDTVPFNNLLKLISVRFNCFFEHGNIYRADYLEYYYNKKDLHPRYLFAINTFFTNLKNAIVDMRESIQSFRKQWDNACEGKIYDFQNSLEMDIMTIPIFENETEYNNDDYVLGKLFDDHPIFGIDYFMKRYKDRSDIILELENMDANKESAEFYCSYNYLRYCLLNNKK